MGLFGSRKKYGIESTTVKGDSVKSKAEKKIADYFSSNGINYIYEEPAIVRAWIFRNKISEPDFFLRQSVSKGAAVPNPHLRIRKLEYLRSSAILKLSNKITNEEETIGKVSEKETCATCGFRIDPIANICLECGTML